MNRATASPIIPSILLSLAMTTGCLKRTDPAVLHTLRPMTSMEEAGAGTPGRIPPALEVLPARLPELLQRPQIVSVQGPGRLGLSEIHRWGNPLEKEIQRVMVENLATLLGSEAIVPAPLGERARATSRLSLDLDRFEGAPGGQIELQGSWTLTPIEGGQATLFRRVRLQEPVPGKDLDALVAAHGRILERLSREIAQELKKRQGTP